MGLALVDPPSSSGWPHTQSGLGGPLRGGCKTRRRSGDEYDQNPLDDILKKLLFKKEANAAESGPYHSV